MIGNLETKLHNLIEAYKQAKQAGEIHGDEGRNYDKLMDKNRRWQRENILNYAKLTSYSDEEYVEKFGEMFDYSDGSKSVHDLARGMHFKTPEKRLAVRNEFENLIKYITDPENDRFQILEEIKDSNSPYKVKGLGNHGLTTLVNSQYPDVPPINGTTINFFRNIGESFPTKLSDQQRRVCEFFNDMVELSNNTITFDDVNQIFYYSSDIDSGIAFMRKNFADTFEKRKTKIKKSKTKIKQEDNASSEIRGW